MRPDRLRDNPAFQATFLQAAQIAARTLQSEKLEALKNAIVNSAMAHDLDENLRQIFLHYIERFTALHLALLKLLDEPASHPIGKTQLAGMYTGGLDDVIEAAIPELRGRKELMQILATDLQAAGLLSGATISTMMSVQSLQTRRSTDLGRAFMSFISEQM